MFPVIVTGSLYVPGKKTLHSGAPTGVNPAGIENGVEPRSAVARIGNLGVQILLAVIVVAVSARQVVFGEKPDFGYEFPDVKAPVGRTDPTIVVASANGSVAASNRCIAWSL
jgi:hypothetical protein